MTFYPKRKMRLIHILLLICLFPMSCLAEEWEDWEEDEDEDLEYFFSTRQKSTISDFPLQEIGGEELSNAAIAGALRANNSSGSLTAKPIYEQEQEENDKQKSSDALKDDELLKQGIAIPIDQFPTTTPQFEQPIYSQPTGRTYGGHMTQTFERP
jgi:hypothetical protein